MQFARQQKLQDWDGAFKSCINIPEVGRLESSLSWSDNETDTPLSAGLGGKEPTEHSRMEIDG